MRSAVLPVVHTVTDSEMILTVLYQYDDAKTMPCNLKTWLNLGKGITTFCGQVLQLPSYPHTIKFNVAGHVYTLHF